MAKAKSVGKHHDLGFTRPSVSARDGPLHSLLLAPLLEQPLGVRVQPAFMTTPKGRWTTETSNSLAVGIQQ